MPFGYAYLNPIYGQLSSGGSAKWVVDPVTPEQGLGAFAIDNSAVDRMNAANVSILTEADGTSAAGESGSMLGGDAYVTAAIPTIGLPSTVDQDGANGLKVNGITEDGSGYDMSASSSFGFAPLMAATWNTDLLYAVGAAFGQESLAHGINGWYCPAINLHRSFFSGRVFEYYSEDPVLSGVLAANVISGAGDQGMFCYIKHFALNETDTGRAELISTWADE